METDRIEIEDFAIYRGPNIYSHRPVMKMLIDIGRYEDIPTKDIPGFNERLLEAFPDLGRNCCSLGYEGGFEQRLRTGTYLGHVLEHTILEMQAMLGYDVHYGKTRQAGERSIYYLVYEYQNEVCGLECSKAAVFILNSFLAGEDVNAEEFMQYLRRVSLEAELGPSTSAIVEEARKRGIPVTRIGNESLVRLGYGKYSRLIESTLTDATPCICADISTNKQLTKSILSEHQIPVPYGKVVYSELSAVIAARQIGTPVVIKPFDGNQGKGVFLNLTKEADIRRAYQEASRYSSGIIVEKFITGRDYRVLVVGGQVRAVAERLPACVTGDGVHTVRELVDIVNQDENRGEQHQKALTRIKLDSVADAVLQRNGLTVDSIPPEGQTVLLRENGNISTGGTAIDYTDRIHPDNAELAVQAASAIGIDIAGIDIVTEDITQSVYDTGGAIVEVNTAPGIRMHLYPSVGQPHNVAADIIDLLFPQTDACRLPIVSVTGTNGKTTVVRLISHVLAAAGHTVGMTSTSGTYIGEKCICKGDNSGPRSAKCLLANKAIDAAVLETARGGILREGLGYDLADVGVITNISEDHLGIDGLETLEDLAYVKSLVAETVKPDGYAVLNADDPMTPGILKRVQAPLILFSKAEHIGEEYLFREFIHVFVREGWIVVKDHGRRRRVVCVADIPITCNGMIECNVENSLTAVAALYGLHVSVAHIANGLKSFHSNTGRFNLFALNGFRVMLDYGHNHAGYEQVINTCRKLGFKRLVGVIGMPGDRADTAIRSVAALCAASFDRLYIKEDDDLRGRQPREVAALFYDAVCDSGFEPQRAGIILSEKEALRTACAHAQPDDLIVVLYEKLEPLVNFLHEQGASDMLSPDSADEHTVQTVSGY